MTGDRASVRKRGADRIPPPASLLKAEADANSSPLRPLEEPASQIEEVSADAEPLASAADSRRGEPAAAAGAGTHRLRRPLLLLAPLMVVAGGLFFYLNGGRYESTDNASLQSGLVSVSPNVEGRVIAVAVGNNEAVHKGDLLFRLDPAPFQAAVDEAEAELAAARAEVGALRATYAAGESELDAAREKVQFADREAARQKDLLAAGISSQMQYDQALLAARTARQAVKTAEQHNRSVQQTLSGDVDAPVSNQPAVQRAQAALDRARLALGYAVVRAPQDGTVAKVDQLQVGDWVEAARPVFSIAGKRLWVEANFKENQLQYMRVGQPATIRIDAFPDLDLRAHVASFSPGTGSSFAVLPAENATGNWVKVVQRLPVELSLDSIPANVPLQAGLSVEATVDTGHTRHIFGAPAKRR